MFLSPASNDGGGGFLPTTESVCVCIRERKKGEHVVVIWLFYCLALVVKVLGRGYERSGSCQKPPESGYPDRPDWERVQWGSTGEREGYS